MPIRPATLSDATGISRLLSQLDYPGTEEFVELRLVTMLQDPAEKLLVWEEEPTTAADRPANYGAQAASTPHPPTALPASTPDQPHPPTALPASAPDQPTPSYYGPPRILGLLSLHFIPQLAVKGDFARISYFAVDDTTRGLGIGKRLEEEANRLAREKGCTLLEVHCHSRRTRAHDFYARQGYIESPKYLIKRL